MTPGPVPSLLVSSIRHLLRRVATSFPPLPSTIDHLKAASPTLAPRPGDDSPPHSLTHRSRFILDYLKINFTHFVHFRSLLLSVLSTTTNIGFQDHQ